jgi:hypothetical protein
VLALEDQLAINKLGRDRERRARRELEAYANPMLVRRRLEDFDRQGNEICQLIVDNSRFAQAALLLESSGRLRLSGAAGMDAAVVTALDSVAARIPVAGFLAPGSVSPAVEHSQTVDLSLEPWLNPGDDLKRLCFSRALAVPIVGAQPLRGAAAGSDAKIQRFRCVPTNFFPWRCLRAACRPSEARPGCWKS